jgi:flagellar motor switch protein FliM
MRTQAVKIPVIATAQVARLKLSAKDLSSLAPGDLLLTDVSATQEMTFDVDGCTVFRGTPGQSENRKVIRLTEPVEHQPSSTEQKLTE